MNEATRTSIVRILPNASKFSAIAAPSHVSTHAPPPPSDEQEAGDTPVNFSPDV